MTQDSFKTTPPAPSARGLSTRHALLAIFVAMAALVGAAFAAASFAKSREALTQTVLMELGFVLAAFVAVGAARLAPAPALSIRRIGAAALLGSALMGLGVWLFSSSLLSRLGREEDTRLVIELLEATRRDLGTGGFLFVMGVFAPVCEELFFRGALFQGGRRRLRTAGALLASALLFGLMHAGGGAVHSVVASVLGIVCGVALLRTGSLIASIMVHIVNNLAALVLYLIAPAAVPPMLVAVPAALLFGLGIYLTTASVPALRQVALAKP